VRGVAFPPLVLNKRQGDRLVSYPATHPILQLALVQMFKDDIYPSFLLGYFSIGPTSASRLSTTPQPTPSYNWLSFKSLMTTFTLLSTSDISPWMGPTSAPPLSAYCTTDQRRSPPLHSPTPSPLPLPHPILIL
jgi:hypothetical protein